MPITQQHFFNSSIRNFNCSIGWGSQSSSLTVNLAEDPVLNEVFTPVLPGLPAYFTFDNFNFGGIVQNYKMKNSPQGYAVWEVSLTDPRDVLEGVQIIIDGYTGSIGAMPNLFNVYGYLESIEYGYAQVNDSGILTTKLRTGLNALLAMGITGSPINYLGANYYVDLSSLPNLPTYHRIGGGLSLSLMDIVSRICEDGGCDFFVTLYQGPIGENVIKVHSISRANQPTFGKINDFILANTTGQAVQNEIGLELRNEVVGKFLVGGPVAAMYFQFDDEGDDETFEDDTILQFWGLDANGAPIIQELNEDNNPKFTLDSRTVNVNGVGATYETDVNEMRTALGGQPGWEIFINSQNDVAGPHFGKAKAIAIPTQKALADMLANFPLNNVDNAVLKYLKTLELQNMAPFTGRHINKFDRGDDHQENITALYQYVSAFAQEYYGKKYMVRIADIQAKIESDTDRIVTNIEPTDGGFIDESDYAGAIGNGLMPVDFDRVTLEDGRLQCYVRFDESDTLVLDDIPPDNIIIQGESVFIKCKVLPTIYVLDVATLSSPRVVVELPGRVYRSTAKNDFAGALKVILADKMQAAGVNPGADQNEIFKALLSKMGADDLMVGLAGIAIKPNMAAIPFKSNVLTYGPWQAHGANGKIEFEQNTELVPWLYGGFTAMNQVGNALVSSSIAGQIRGETGSITVPDGPNYNIGSELIAGGPYITSVNVEVGENGVTSTYRMETWSPRFGKLAKLNAERMSKLAKENVVRKRELKKLARLPGPGHIFFEARANANLKPPPREEAKTSSLYIGGQIHKLPDEEVRHNDVAIMSEYNSLRPLSYDYENKAFMSLDGLFRPFSTKKTDVDVPHYETPESSAEKTVDDLDPFKEGTDVKIIATDTALEEDTHIKDMTSPNKRPMALRGPLVVAGWGYTTDGKPVPNLTPDSPGDEFLTDHLTRSDKWKVGPVDLRWDQSRKLWAAGNGANTRVIKLLGDLYYGSTASGVLMDLGWNGSVGSNLSWTEASGQIVTVGEPLGSTFYDTIAVTDTRQVLAIQSNENQELYLVFSAFLE